MPRQRTRAKILSFLRKLNADRFRLRMMRDEHRDNSSDISDMSMQDALDDYYIALEQSVSSTRYLFRPTQYRNRGQFFDWEDCLSENSVRFNNEDFLNGLSNLIKYKLKWIDKKIKLINSYKILYKFHNTPLRYFDHIKFQSKKQV